jgi:hypothetical protein
MAFIKAGSVSMMVSGGAFVQGFNEFLQDAQILDIVFGLIELIREIYFHHLVLSKEIRNVILFTTDVFSIIAIWFRFLESFFNNLEIIAVKLFTKCCDVLKSLLPVEKFSLRSWAIFVILVLVFLINL